MKVWNALLALLMLAAVSTAQQRGSMSDQVPQGKMIVMPTPTAQAASLEQLIKMSPLIVYGTVASVPPSVQLGENQRHPSVETHSLFAVDTVLKGAVLNNSGIIVLAQSGGRSGELEVIVPDDPLVKESERYILFLMRDENEKTRPNISGIPRYCAVGIWSGKVRVVNGKIAFQPSAHARLHEYDNLDLATFTQLIKNMIASPVIPNINLPIHPGGGAKKK